MHRPRCIAIYGTSLFMQSIQAALSLVPDMVVTALAKNQPDLIATLNDLKPDLMVLEKDYIDTAVLWSIVQLGFSLIELTPGEMTGRIIHSEQRAISTTDDLLAIISA